MPGKFWKMAKRLPNLELTSVTFPVELLQCMLLYSQLLLRKRQVPFAIPFGMINFNQTIVPFYWLHYQYHLQWTMVIYLISGCLSVETCGCYCLLIYLFFCSMQRRIYLGNKNRGHVRAPSFRACL